MTSETVSRILQSIFNRIRLDNKYRTENETHETRILNQKLIWKYEGEMTIQECQIIVNRYVIDYIEKRKYDSARNDSKYVFKIPVNQIENKQDYDIKETKMRIRYILKDLRFTVWENSKAVYCDVLYKIKIFNGGIIVITVKETLKDFNLFTEVNNKIIRSRSRGLLFGFHKYDDNIGISEKDYKFIDEKGDVVPNGILKDFNYFSHRQIYIIKTIKSNIECKKIQLDVIPNLFDIIYLYQYNILNYSFQKIKTQNLNLTSKNKILLSNQIIETYKDNYNEVFLDNVGKRYRIRTLPTFEGIKDFLDKPKDTLERFLERGEFKLFFIYIYLTDVELRLAVKKFKEMVIDQIPLSGMYIGSDNELFDLCGKNDLKKDMLKLLEEYEWLTKSVIPIHDVSKTMEIYTHLKGIYDYIDLVNSLELKNYLKKKYFTFTKTYEFDRDTIYPSGLWIWRWIRTSTQKNNDSGLNFREANTIEDGLQQQDFTYCYRVIIKDIPTSTVVVSSNFEPISTNKIVDSNNNRIGIFQKSQLPLFYYIKRDFFRIKYSVTGILEIRFGTINYFSKRVDDLKDIKIVLCLVVPMDHEKYYYSQIVPIEAWNLI
jgi:hypothetical protein